MNDCPVEVEPSNIQTNTINKFNIQSFKNYKRKLLQMVFRFEVIPWFIRIYWLYDKEY